MSDLGKTFRLRYVGPRFEGTRLSVDVLLDLPAFNDLLVAFAKDEWRQVNSERQRVPKGFDKSISLDLVAVDDGSAVPVLNWDRQIAQAMLPGFKDELETIVDSSFNDIIKLINNAGNDEFPRSLPLEHVRALNKFGSGLRDGERIEFVGTSDDSGRVIYLDNYRRKKIITRVRETYQVRIEGSGQLLGSVVRDAYQGYIVVDTIEFGEIKVHLEATRITEDFDGYIGASVQFDMQVELDNSDKFRDIVEVFEISLVDAKFSIEMDRCRDRLNELRSLAAGWQDGCGSIIDPFSLELAELFLARRFYLSELYKIYPTEDGRVLVEFEANKWDYSIEFGPGKNVEMYGVEVAGDGEMEPQSFSGISEEFLKEFDTRVGR